MCQHPKLAARNPNPKQANRTAAVSDSNSTKLDWTEFKFGIRTPTLQSPNPKSYRKPSTPYPDSRFNSHSV
jgi:hypothetical protein